MTYTTTEPRSGYREPLVWLVAAIPLLTVVAGITTVVVANRGADSVVVDDFRKEGLAIHQDPRRDEAAARLGVSARLAAGGTSMRVELASGAAAAPAKLVVLLSHATRAELDRMLTLPLGADGVYATDMQALPPGHWHVEISPADREWRLTGEFHDAASALALRATEAAAGAGS